MPLLSQFLHLLNPISLLQAITDEVVVSYKEKEGIICDPQLIQSEQGNVVIDDAVSTIKVYL